MKRTPLLVKWSIIAVVIGPLCGYVVVLFKRMATASAQILYQHTDAFYLALPVGGALVVALLYLFVPGAAGEGMPSYVDAIRSGNKRLPFKVTIAKFFSAGIVLASGGSGGMVGPISRVCAGLGQDVGSILSKFGFEATVVRHAAICGASAGISAILGAPVAGALFAVEILFADNINYQYLFPALLSSATAFLVVYTRPDYQPFLGHIKHSGFFQLGYLPALVAVGIATTLFGILFCKVFSFVNNRLTKYVPRLSLRCLVGAVLVVGTAASLGPLGRSLLGPGIGFIKNIVAGGIPVVQGGPAGEISPTRIAVILVFLAAGKMLATSFTIGSGLSAGLTYPSILIGAAVGSAGARLSGVDPTASPETYYAFVACGVAALLASVMNIPLAAAVLAAEIFGFNQSVPGIIGSVIAYSLARHIVIYRYK